MSWIDYLGMACFLYLVISIWRSSRRVKVEELGSSMGLKCVYCGTWAYDDAICVPKIEFALNSSPAKADYVLLRLKEFYCAPNWQFHDGSHPNLLVEGITRCEGCGTFSLWNYSVAPVAILVGTVN